MAKDNLTDDERKALDEYLQAMEQLTEQEPEHIENTLTPAEKEQAENYYINGQGTPPEKLAGYKVTTAKAIDRDGQEREHIIVIDPNWDAWNEKCNALSNQYKDVITKALAFQLTNADMKGKGLYDILKAFLDKNPAPSDFFNMPTSPVTSLILDALNYGGEIQHLPNKKRYISHGTKNEVSEKGNARRITRTNQKSEISAELADIYKFLGTNEAATNLFVLSLIKADEQAIHNGHLEKEFITFSLQELVDLGLYKTVRSARNGFNAGSDALTSIKIRGRETKKTGKQATTSDALEVLFTGARIKNGQCYLFLNDRVNWGFIAEFYTILPRYYFRLPTRAKSLLLYIFSLARQHTRDIEEKGYFTISFRAIQSALNLPSEIGRPNPRRDTVGAIEKAVEKIEDANHEYFHTANLQLQPVYNESAPVSDCLDTGYLKVTLKGQYAEFFVEISQKTGKKIAAAKKRKEKIQDDAKTKALTDKIKSNTENDKDNKTDNT